MSDKNKEKTMQEQLEWFENAKRFDEDVATYSPRDKVYALAWNYLYMMGYNLIDWEIYKGDTVFGVVDNLNYIQHKENKEDLGVMLKTTIAPNTESEHTIAIIVGVENIDLLNYNTISVEEVENG